MAVHVGEIHTELSTRASGAGAEDGSGTSGPQQDRRPGAHEDQWRAARARVGQLEHRVCTEDSDD